MWKTKNILPSKKSHRDISNLNPDNEFFNTIGKHLMKYFDPVEIDVSDENLPAKYYKSVQFFINKP